MNDTNERCEACGVTEELDERQLVQPDSGTMMLCHPCWEEYRQLRGLTSEKPQQDQWRRVTRSRIHPGILGD